MIQKVIYTILFLFSSISIAQACTCISFEWQEKEIYDEHELIFIGKSKGDNYIDPTGKEQDFNNISTTKVELEVVNLIKWTGENVISVWSDHSYSCGMITETGEEYLVTLNPEINWEYNVGICNMKAVKENKKIIANLIKIQNLEQNSSIEIEKLSRYERFKRYLISFISLLW